MIVKHRIEKVLGVFNWIWCRDAETSRFINEVFRRADIVDNIEFLLFYGFADECEK